MNADVKPGERLTQAGHTGRVVDHANGFHVIECEPCGFKHILPIPDAADLQKVYEEEYYTTEKPDYLKHYEEDSEWWKLTYDDRYDYFENILPTERRRILDIGSGPGFFLRRGKERGWQTLGIEPSRQAAEYSRTLGLEIRNEFLTAETQRLGQFDVIHMSAVLEHIPDPIGMLETVHSLSSPEGIICVVVPNDFNPFQLALRDHFGFKPWWVAPPHHINYFNFDSLSKLVEKSGFNVVHVESTFPIDMFLLMGDNYVGNDQLGRACHAKRKTFEQNLATAGLNDIKRRLYHALAENGLGREVVVVGRKR